MTLSCLILIHNTFNHTPDQYAEKQFSIQLDKGLIICKEDFVFHKKISPKKNVASNIIKSLYVEEEEMNDFERKVIYEVANLDSVVFWHKNLERGKGFLLNCLMDLSIIILIL